jgi:hypothetical protein
MGLGFVKEFLDLEINIMNIYSFVCFDIGSLLFECKVMKYSMYKICKQTTKILVTVKSKCVSFSKTLSSL